MRRVRSAGVLLVRPDPTPSVLLLRHAHRFDLPKGHVEPGESDRQAALRELLEETGIPEDAVQLWPGVCHTACYQTPYARFGGAVVEKTVVIFTGRLVRPVPLVLTEHRGGGWEPLTADLRTGNATIDGALAALRRSRQAPAR